MTDIGEINNGSELSGRQREVRLACTKVPLTRLVELAEQEKGIKAIRLKVHQPHNWLILGMAYVAFLFALLCLL
jgi:hypothetical protein